METSNRSKVRVGMKVRLPANHANSPGKEAIVVFCGAYQCRVRLIHEPRETWAFSDDVEIIG